MMYIGDVTKQLTQLLRRKAIVMMAGTIALAGCATNQVQDNTGAESSEYRELSRVVFKETNRLRANPKAYAAELRDVERRIKGGIYYPENSEVGVRMAEGKHAVREAIAEISTQGPRPVLRWSDALAKAALAHVQDIGPKGLVSHESSSGQTLSERLKPVMAKEKFTAIAENISFGLDQGRDVVAHLFIDDGVPGRGHRKNLLMKKLNYTGVACGYHKRYRDMCVAIYAYKAE